MYFWKVDTLIEEVKNEKVSQKEQLKYVVAFSIIMILASDPMMSIGRNYSFLDSISSVLMLVISIVGVYWCYLTNQKTDDKDFIFRFFTIGFPIGVRFAVILIPVAIVLGTLEIMLDGSYKDNVESLSSTSTTSIYQVIFFSLSQIIFYFYYSSKFKLFARG